MKIKGSLGLVAPLAAMVVLSGTGCIERVEQQQPGLLANSSGPVAITPENSRSYFDSRNIETISGKVSAVIVYPSYKEGKKQNFHQLVLTTENSDIDVILGPGWFLTQNNYSFQFDDELTISGSLINQNGTTYLIATTIASAQKTLTIRSQDGSPSWTDNRQSTNLAIRNRNEALSVTSL